MYRQGNYTKTNWRGYRPSQPQAEGSPAPPLGTLIETIAHGGLSESAEGLASCARVTNCNLLASYNWLDRAKPSILVPGTV